MELLVVIGNLGSDAEVRSDNGREYVRFNVADSRRWQAQDGKEHEETIWNQCIMPGKQEKLLPYLLKGTKVCVVGRASTRVYSSAKERRMVAGISIQVDRLELVSTVADPVPRQIVSPDGELVPVSKTFFIDYTIARKYAGEQTRATFFDRNGQPAFFVDYNGFVFPAQSTAQSAAPDTSEQSGNDASIAENAPLGDDNPVASSAPLENEDSDASDEPF